MRRFVHFVTAGTVNEWGEKMVRIPRKQKKRTPGHHSLYHHSLTTTSTLLPLALNYFLNKINLNLAVFLVFCHSCLSYVYVYYILHFAFCISASAGIIYKYSIYNIYIIYNSRAKCSAWWRRRAFGFWRYRGSPKVQEGPGPKSAGCEYLFTFASCMWAGYHTRVTALPESRIPEHTRRVL